MPVAETVQKRDLQMIIIAILIISVWIITILFIIKLEINNMLLEQVI